MQYSEDASKQYHIQVGPGDVGRYVFLTGDPKRCEKIARYFDEPHLMADSREFVTYTGKLDGIVVSVTSTGIGGASAAIALEELVNCGADTFIRIGTCGGMQKDVKSGDLVIAQASIRQDGTNKEYAPVEYPAAADFEITWALKEAAKAQKRSAHVGIVQSKDSFYGQHDPSIMPVSFELENKWQAWLRMGCLASEMETATLFIVGAYRHVRVGAVMLTLANQEREKAGLENPVVRDMDGAVKTAVGAMRKVIFEDHIKETVVKRDEAVADLLNDDRI